MKKILLILMLVVGMWGGVFGQGYRFAMQTRRVPSDNIFPALPGVVKIKMPNGQIFSYYPLIEGYIDLPAFPTSIQMSTGTTDAIGTESYVSLNLPLVSDSCTWKSTTVKFNMYIDFGYPLGASISSDNYNIFYNIRPTNGLFVTQYCNSDNSVRLTVPCSFKNEMFGSTDTKTFWEYTLKLDTTMLGFPSSSNLSTLPNQNGTDFILTKSIYLSLTQNKYGVPVYFKLNRFGSFIYSDILGTNILTGGPSEFTNQVIYYQSFPVPKTKTTIGPTCFGGKGSITLSNFKYDDGTAYNGGENLNLSITRQGAGIADTSLVFSASTINITGLSPGNYIAQYGNAAGTCSQNFDFTIPAAPAQITASATVQNPDCSTGSGIIAATAGGGTPPYQYSLNGGTTYQTSNVFSNLSSGSYTVTITDANNCTPATSTALNVVIPTAVNVTLSNKRNPSGAGLSNGQIVVAASGGTGSTYTYAINNGAYASADTFSSLAAGTYNITAKDSKGCVSAPLSVVLTEPQPLTASLSSKTDNNCFGASLGTIEVSVSGGVTPYSYAIGESSYQTNNSFTNLAAGDYSITIKDANGNIATLNTTISQPAKITANVVKTDATCYGGNGNITINNVAGVSGSTYSYSSDGGVNYQSGNVFSLPQGTYTIKIKDENGCSSDSYSITINQPAASLSATATKQDVACYGASNGNLKITATGGSGSYSYSIDNWLTSNTSGEFAGLPAGTYAVKVKDQAGCTFNLSIQIDQPQELQLYIDGKTDALCFGGTGTISVSTTGGQGNITYSSTPSLSYSNGLFSGASAGTYVIQIIDENGCTKTANVTINQPGQLSITATTTSVSCNGGSDGSVSLSASGGTGTYTYSIKNLNTYSSSSTFNGLAAGSHSFTVKDQNGCTTDITVTVTQPEALALATSAKSNVTCNGAANGSITVSASGGNSGYTYRLNGTDMGGVSSFTGLAPGSYTIRVTDAKGCTREITENITQPNSLVLSLADQTNILCNGGTGSITVGTTGGTAPYQYSIDGTNFQSGTTFGGLAAGNYSISVRDTNGCMATLAVELAQPATLALTISNKTDVTCSGSGNGSVTLAATGGTAPYRYRIGTAAPQLSNKFESLSGGSYALTVTDANGCTASTSVTIAEPSQLTVAASTTAVGCNGGSDGSVSLSASGGMGTYTYSIKNNNSFSSSSTFSGLAAGSHSFTVKDQNGCTADITVTVNQPDALAIATSTKSNVTCNGAANGSITVLASGGNSGYTYRLNGTDMGGVSSFTGLAAGSYTIRVTDAKGCTMEITENITQPNNLVVSVTDKTDILCNGGSTGSVTLQAAGGIAPYQYSIDGTNFQSGATFDGLAAGNYSISVRDANGCTATLAVELVQPATLALGTSTKTDVTCNGSGNGSVTLAATGGTAPYRYRIGNQPLQLSNRFDNLAGGSYTLTVTDANGCTASTSVTISEPSQLSLAASTTAVGCNGGSDGSVSLSASGGTGTYTYSVKNLNSFSSSNTFSGLAVGSHSFTVKDQNGCTADITITVTQPDALALATSAKSNVTCNGAANGSITVSASGGNSGYTYQLNGKDIGGVATFTGLAAGSYTISVTDVKGCKKDITETITQPSALTVSVTNKTDIVCSGGSTGSVTLGATGGTSPYQYSIDGTNFQSGATFDGLAAGNYTVSVKDANNCSATLAVELAQPDALSLGISTKTNVTCSGSGNGSVTLAATGGTAPYRYRIGTQPLQLSNRFDNLKGGDYNFNVLDANGCAATISIKVVEPAQLTLAASTTAVGCNGGSDGSVLLSASGGTGTYTYSIKNNNSFSSSNTFSGLAAGSHSFTVKDQNGCTADITVTVNQPDALALATSAKINVTCNGAANGSITALASGGNGGYTYQLNGKDMGSVSTFTGLAAGSYTIRVTDAKGCTREITENITQPNSLVVSVTDKTDILCNGGSTGSVTVGTTGGTAPYQYSIDGTNFQSAPTFSGLAAGSYNISVRDANNCTGNIVATISQPSLLTLSVSAKTNVTCNGSGNGSVTLVATGGTAPYRYRIGTATFQLSNRFENLAGGSYTVTVTDANGCSTVASFTIAEPSQLSLAASTTAVGCNGGSDGSVSLSASGGTGTYTYSIKNLNNFSSSNTFSGLAAGSHSFTVKDQNGCTTDITVTVTQPDALALSTSSKNNVTCNGAANGSITVAASGGNGGYTYQLNGTDMGSVSTFTGLAAGSYTIRVTDAKRCTREITETIIQPNNLTLSLANQTNVNCFGSNTASVTIGVSGGTSPYQYSIDGSTFQSGATFSGLAVGSYTFTVKDINNCTSRITATISQPSLLALSVSSKTDVACNGAKNGTVSLTASGGTAPYRYSIGTSAYQSSNRFENLSGGNYVLNVIDANGCSATSNVTINENPALNIEVAEFKNVTCNGNHSGEITLRASGGAGNYQYSLNNGTYQSSPVFSQLAAGNYQLTVKDEKGCTSSITKMITQPLPLVVSKQVTQQKCFDACSGEIKLEVSGGTAPYTYQWSGGIYGNVSSINNLCGGLYKVTIVDANGCSIEDATTIVTPPEIMINGIADTILCVDQVITYDAGNPGLTYQWTADNGFLRNTQKVQISQAGKYQLKVTNSDGCFVTKNFTIQTSTTLLKANFLASTFANVGDTVIIIDVSKPTPSKTSWIFETGAVDLGGNATGNVKQITFNAPGVYNLMMMVSLGQCTDAVQKSITVLPKEQKTAVSDALGYKEELIKEFKAYPNPNAGDFKTIIKLSTKQDIKLTLFDFNGAVVLPTQTHVGKDTYEVDFSQKNLQTGLYIVALEAGNQLKTLKIIKL